MKKYILRRLGVAHDPGSAKPTLQGCLEAVLEQSDTLMNDILDGLRLAATPSKTDIPYPQKSTGAAAAQESLHKQRDEVKRTFSAALRSAVYGGETQRVSTEPLVRFDDFQFLEEEQIDANIELALTQQDVMQAVDSVLPMLNAFVSSLLGFVTVNAHANPLKPESFVYALRETLAEHLPDEELRGAVIALAAGLLGKNLRSLYKEIVEWLRSQGIEPAGALNVSDGKRANPTENAVTRTLLTLDKLRKLLSGELEQASPSAVLGEFTHTVPASYVALDDMKLVEPMMKRLAQRASQSAATKVAGSLSASDHKGIAREQTQRKDLGRQLGEEVLRLMLENLMQDRRLLPAVRQSLLAMEPILLKLSRSDTRFFSERQHPARQFLDKITHRSLAFASQEEAGFLAFRAVFDQCVQELSASECDATA